DRLEALKRDLEANPPQTINELIARVRTLFGTAGADAGVGAVAASAGVGAVAAFAAAPVGAAGASGGSPIAFAFNNGVLEVTLNYAIDETRQLNLGFDLDDALNAGILEQFVDVTARAPLTLGIGGAIRVGVAVDVNNPLSPAFYVKDSSQIRLTTLVNAPDIDIQAAVGPLGIFIRDGRVHLDNGTAGQPATWTVGLAPGADGRHALSSLFANLGSLATFAAVGRLEAELPVKFPVEGRGVGSIALGVRDLGHIAGTTALTMPMPDFEGMLAGLDLAGLIGLVVEGLDRSLGAIAERFDDSDLPLIGDDLDKAAGFLDRIREAVIRKLQEAVAFTDDLVTEKIFQAVGPAGLDWLADRNGDGRITADDVAVTFATAGARADVAFRLAGRSAVDRPVDLDLGLPGLGLDVDAALNLAVNFRFDVGFGVSKSEGFYVHTDDFSTPELKVWIEAILSDKTLGAGGALAHPATATAELAFLRFTATDRAITRADGSRSGSYFLGEFTVDLKDPGGDGRLTLAEMASAADITEVIDPRLSATAHVMLGLEAG
ncbi:MAG TPA: hypothetical protein VF590_05970, partial [Isosphaeraceae bacterium]